MRPRHTLVLAFAALACGVQAAPAGAESARASPAGGASGAIASVTAETPISAGAGWLVWSVPVAGGWALDAYHHETVSQLPAAPRPQPFDASVGSDETGAPVVVFSRCARTPEMRDVGISEEKGGALLVARTGAGCRIHVLELDSGREHALPIPAPAGSSDTTPSMWHGDLAFARHAPGHGPVWQVMSWSQRAPRRVLTLRHGAIPVRCENGGPCKHPADGEVQALSRDGQIVTFLWHLEGTGIIGEGAWELRVDRLAGDSSSLAASGFGHEACTSALAPGELEYVWPEPPVAVGRTVLSTQLDGFDCFKGFAATLESYVPGAAHAQIGALAHPVLGLAVEGSTLYGLAPGPKPADSDTPGCAPTDPCSLERIAAPTTMKLQSYVPKPPFVEYFIHPL
jgi:hypothetical protein